VRHAPFVFVVWFRQERWTKVFSIGDIVARFTLFSSMSVGIELHICDRL
jgi:hypothetical protein